MEKKQFNFRNIQGMLSRDEMKQVKGGYGTGGVCTVNCGDGVHSAAVYEVANCTADSQKNKCAIVGQVPTTNTGGGSCYCIH